MPYDWSAGGKRILAVNGKKIDPEKQLLPWVDLSDGPTAAVRTVPKCKGVSAFVSSDGRHIALGTKRPGEVHLMGSDGIGGIVAAAHPAGEWPVDWSPDGKLVLFISLRPNSPGLWAIPIANGKPSGGARSLPPPFRRWCIPAWIHTSWDIILPDECRVERCVHGVHGSSHGEGYLLTFAGSVVDQR